MAPVNPRITPATAVVGRNVRRRRDEHALSLSALARRSGIAKATLSAIEAGDGNPTVTTLEAVAAALDLSLSQLLESGDEALTRVVRNSEAQRPDTDDVLIESFSCRGLMEVYDIRYEPGFRVDYQAHPPGFVERVMLHQGRLLAGTTEEPVEMEAGDFLFFPSDRPHVYETIGSEPARGVLLAAHPHPQGEDSPIHPASRI